MKNKGIKILVVLSSLLCGWSASAQGIKTQTKSISDLLMSQKDSSLAKELVDSLLSIDDEQNYKAVVEYYSKINQPLAFENIWNQAIKKFPKGFIAMSDATTKLRTEKDPDRQRTLLNKMKNDFPDQIQSEDFKLNSYVIAYNYAALGRTDDALIQLQTLKNVPEYIIFLSTILEQLNPHEPKRTRELLSAQIDGMHNGDRGLSAIAGLYGKLLADDEDFDKALHYTKISIDQPGSKNKNAIMVYPWLLYKTGDLKGAFPLLKEIVIKGNPPKNIEAAFLDVFLKTQGDQASYDSFMVNLQNQRKTNAFAKIKKEMINEEAPNFQVSDADGKIVTLKDFAGKVIFLDFWATWCGPCKASFPEMQKVVNEFAQDKDVVFLFIHTWERSETPLADANSYLKKNNLNLPLFMDIKNKHSRKNEAVTSFGLSGIPAKVVIDRGGNIRFKKMGYNASEDNIAELREMINLAKS
jgi:Thiol-disulfide isomerase and thioredoxins